MYDSLIARATAGSLDAVKALSQLCANDISLFRRVTPLFFTHLDQIPPIPDVKAVREGFAPSLPSVELAIYCIEALNQGCEALAEAGALAEAAASIENEVSASEALDAFQCRIPTDWPILRPWLQFFVRCLDSHRQAAVISEYQDLYKLMLSASVSILSMIVRLSLSRAIADSRKQEFFLISQAPGYLSLVVQLAILPSQLLVTTGSWADITTPFSVFCHIAHRPVVGDEFAAAMLECMNSPGAIEIFRDRMLKIMARINKDDLQPLRDLVGYVTFPFYLAVCSAQNVEPVQRALFWDGMLPSLARVMAQAQFHSISHNMPRSRLLYQCGFYLLVALKKEGYLAALEALKGAYGMLFSISRASPVLVGEKTYKFSIVENNRVLKVYVDLLEEITLNLIHPAVLRRCARRLRKHTLLLKTDDPRFQPLVDASKNFLRAVTQWQSKRREYKKRDHNLCGNPK
ncbi:hypothetical protein C8J56DRAFT_1024280, partial [Mycena floridula]